MKFVIVRRLGKALVSADDQRDRKGEATFKSPHHAVEA